MPDGTLVRLLPDGGTAPMTARADEAKLDATTDTDIVRHMAEDETAAMRDAAAYARRVRRKIGLSQAGFARRIGVPVDTVRNWEQGKRSPQGPARALLRLIDRAPELALNALEE